MASEETNRNKEDGKQENLSFKIVIHFVGNPFLEVQRI